MYDPNFAQRLLDASNSAAQRHRPTPLQHNNQLSISKTNDKPLRPISAYLQAQKTPNQQQNIQANDRFFRPQTASCSSLHSGIKEARSHANSAIPGSRALTNSTSNIEFGIQGYKLPHHGLPPRAPVYSVPKDRLSNFLEQTQKRGKALPAPNAYQKPLSWQVHNVQFGKSSNRKTFTDEVQKIAKTIPSPCQYNPKKKYSVLLGKSDKALEVGFLSDVAYLGKLNPSPSQYTPMKEKFLPRSSSWSIMKPFKEKERGWKPKKADTPDVGTYEPAKSVVQTKKSYPKHAFPKSKSLKFTVEFANYKKAVPGVGTYKIEPCFKKVAIPYMKKRL